MVANKWTGDYLA